ncbi:MAG: hypothetical protein N2C14_08875 [Planctomycetales bacterium]
MVPTEVMGGRTAGESEDEEAMNRSTILLAVMGLAFCFSGSAADAQDCYNCSQGHHRGHRGGRHWGNRRGNQYGDAGGQVSWHGAYYNTAWGGPVSLVVPPTAYKQGHYHWGVPSTSTSWVTPQFQGSYPGSGMGGGQALYPTPAYPSHTDQFGVYYTRGPWW